MRIAKFIAANGICSRREAETLITRGVVKIDGEVIDSPAINVSDQNIVHVDGKKLEPIPDARLWVYYKPLGLITTHSDPQNRPTIFQALDSKLPRVISVGRLDINSEGILLLTNNGMLSRYFEKPSNKIERVYKVRAYGGSRPINIQNKTIGIEGINYHPKSIKLIKKGINSWYEVILTEGKNREIRKIFEYFGFEVNRLIRIRFGEYSLGTLEPGEYKEVKISENYFWKTQK